MVILVLKCIYGFIYITFNAIMTYIFLKSFRHDLYFELFTVASCVRSTNQEVSQESCSFFTIIKIGAGERLSI